MVFFFGMLYLNVNLHSPTHIFLKLIHNSSLQSAVHILVKVHKDLQGYDIFTGISFQTLDFHM